jgi:hypothetical protein
MRFRVLFAMYCCCDLATPASVDSVRPFRLAVSPTRLRYKVVLWSCVEGHYFGSLVLFVRELAAPRFVFATAQCAPSGYDPVRLSWAIADVVLLCTEATCCYCLARGAFAVFFGS